MLADQYLWYLVIALVPFLRISCISSLQRRPGFDLVD
jgi:hypothetical protein